ncbi:transcription factor bHLH68 isoform X2 [Asparagus officinalis]|uniref:transcription factor bHLH68 isoform X2 n=1 Tax=Asparagus officinalis TaxID=4686 RepID=UPI00098E817C|nr:transcription factor bHLH68 isoform X2 [Asparagus officinalis]
MNRGAFESTNSIHQMMGGAPGGLWSLDSMRPTHPLQTYPLLPPSSSSSSSTASSSSSLPQFLQPSNLHSMASNWHDNQEPPESWSQLLMGGLVEEDRCCLLTPFQNNKVEKWQNNLMYPPSSACIDVKQDLSTKGCIYGQTKEEIQTPRSSWSQFLPNSSPRSCVTTNFNGSMLDFANNKTDTRQQELEHSSQECNSTSTGSPYKKARVQASSAQSTFKVRKEKLGDRITALHQLVSPFGKTDTASVLLEAIGYIRFLQSQIEALSSPYLASSTGIVNMKPAAANGERNCIFPEDPGQDNDTDLEPKKDLRSRGLCLVPVSFTLHVGSDNGADYWAPTFGGGFR